jgi:hypothetical protein
MMKKSAWLLAAVLIGSSVVVSTPSSAQVQFGIGPDGPSVQVGPDRDRDRYERRYIERRRVYDRDDLSTGSVDRCRTVVIREEEPNGDIVTRRVRRCR